VFLFPSLLIGNWVGYHGGDGKEEGEESGSCRAMGGVDWDPSDGRRHHNRHSHRSDRQMCSSFCGGPGHCGSAQEGVFLHGLAACST
jgi:hypothetical protein